MNRQVAHYTLVRLLPQADAGEFVNIGVVLTCPARRQFDFQLLKHTARVTHFFPEFSAALYKQVRDELRTDLNYLKARVADGADPLAVLTELCRPRESMLRYAAPRTLFSADLDETLARLMSRFVQRDGQEVQRRREELIARQVRQILATQKLGEAFKPQDVGDSQFHVRLPFVCQRGGVAVAAIKPLDLAQDESQKIFEHGGMWIQRLRRLRRMNLIPGGLLIPTERPPAADLQRFAAAEDIEQELRELDAIVVSADSTVPIVEFAQLHAA